MAFPTHHAPGGMPHAEGHHPAGPQEGEHKLAPAPLAANLMQLSERHLVTRDQLQTILADLDPTETLDDEAAELLTLMASEFVDSAADFATKLAKHRGSSVVEAKDVMLFLEKSYGIKVAFPPPEAPQQQGHPRPPQQHAGIPPSPGQQIKKDR